ncbi:MAG: class II aldolase/adducin family protein [Gammaproteobacteria bacterium]|nr:class II aldolase/adducin family protein [Gammaproteobacteria bacterium]
MDLQPLVDAAHASVAKGLNRGATGNLSLRDGDAFWITPSGFPLDRVDAGHLVQLGADGERLAGSQQASSEWPLHAAVYRSHPEIAAVVHTHSNRATALACLRRPIPAFHYMVAAAGGHEIPCADYYAFGSPQLARVVAAALAGHRACLLANHGVVATGEGPAGALALAELVESLADQYLQALALGGPVLLSEEEMDEVLERFRNYTSHYEEG